MCKHLTLLQVILILILTGFALIAIFEISAEASRGMATPEQVYIPYPRTRTLELVRVPTTSNMEVTTDAVYQAN